jgi:hypothetical protein
MLEKFVSDFLSKKSIEIKKLMNKQDILTRNVHSGKKYLEDLASISDLAGKDYNTLCNDVSDSGFFFFNRNDYI